MVNLTIMTSKDNVVNYSEMIISIAQKFDDQLPKKLAFEEVLDITVEAWNIANNKEFLVERELYEKELSGHKYKDVIEKIIDHKMKIFPNYNNLIIDYNTDGNRLQVKTQTQKNQFESIIKRMASTKPNKKENS
jgi:hypothetical protein